MGDFFVSSHYHLLIIMKFVWFTLFFVLAVLCVAYAQQTRNVQPEPVTDPVVLRRLNCQMHCRNELEDQSPDCIYNCISPKCYRRVFKKIIDKETGRVCLIDVISTVKAY